MQEKKIYDINELAKVITFLKNGFPEHKKELDKLSSYIQVSNQKLGFYGFVHYDDKEKIDGAILTPLQCQKHEKVLSKPVINLSSWFMLKKSRGIKVINFAKFFLRELGNFYITNYSANKEAYSIFKFLGFKDLFVFKVCTSFLIIFSVKPLKFGINKKISKEVVKEKYKEIRAYNIVDDVEFYEFFNNTESFAYALRKRKSVIHTYFGIRLEIPILDIVWCSDGNTLSKNWKLFCKTNFLQKLNLGIYCNFSSNNLLNLNKFDLYVNTRKLKKNILTFGSLDQKLIYTLGSEILIF